MDIIQRAKNQTNFIMSFPPIRYYLEKGLNETKSGILVKKSVFSELVEEFKGDLTKDNIMNNVDVEVLKKLDIQLLPKGLILILFHGMPLIGYNLQKISELFIHPGWVFHATSDVGLSSCSKNGFLLSPIELLFEKKSYPSERFNNLDLNSQRLTAGISFAYQDYLTYQDYTKRRNNKGGQVSGIGGFFIFPLYSLLTEGQVLTFDTVDRIGGFPEVSLLDQKQKDFHSFYFSLLLAKEKYDEILANFEEDIQFFNLMKQNPENFTSDITEIYKNGIVAKTRYIVSQKYLRRFLKIQIPPDWVVGHFTECCKENDIFTFLLIMNNCYYNEDSLIPRYKVFAEDHTLNTLNGTVFHSFQSTYLIPDTPGLVPSIFLIAELQKRTSHFSGAIAGILKNLSSKDIKYLVAKVRKDVIESIKILIPRTRTKNPVKVDIRNGILFLTREWYKNQINKSIDSKEVLKRLVDLGVPIILGFATDIDNCVGSEILAPMFYRYLNIRDLTPLPDEVTSLGRPWRAGYFYCKNNGDNKEIYYKSEGSEIRVI